MELLNRKNEETWVDKLDIDHMGAYIIGNRFNAFKQEMISLRETLERHFNTIMLSIQNGLPEVEESEVDQIDYMFKLGEN